MSYFLWGAWREATGTYYRKSCGEDLLFNTVPRLLPFPQPPPPTSSHTESPSFFLQQRLDGSSPLLPEVPVSRGAEVWSWATPPSPRL